MSGVVVKLNDDEEEDEDDTGLLSRRGYDDSDEDLDDFRQKPGMMTKSLDNTITGTVPNVPRMVGRLRGISYVKIRQKLSGG